MAKKKGKSEYEKRKQGKKDEASGEGKKVSEKTRETLRKKAAEKEGVSLATLIQVYKRGLGAFFSSGSRPGVSAHQWAMGRVNSFLKGSKKHDTDLR
mgnify:FL=1